MTPSTTRFWVGLLCGGAVFMAGCQQVQGLTSTSAPGGNPDNTPGSGKELQPGTQAPDSSSEGGAAQTRARHLKQLQSYGAGLADIPIAQAYLDRLIEKIQRAGPQPPLFAHVLVRPRLTYNAETTADGFIVIDLGWLKTIDAEPELAALLAHEYGHLRLGHLETKNNVGLVTHFVTLAGAATAAKTGTGNYWSMAIVNSGWSEALMPSWSRNQEFAADQFSVDTMQTMEYAFVPSVRAFLERIQSVERAADRSAGRVATKAAPAVAIGEDHPPIEDRIAMAQKSLEGRARVRPARRPADEWLAVKKSAAFRSSEEEYILIDAFISAARDGRKDDMSAATRRLELWPKPLKTAAAMTMVALSTPDDARRLRLLREAIAEPNASFVPYLVLATLQRDSLNDFEGATETLQAGLDRFDSPPQQYPIAIEFRRVLRERIESIPKEKRPFQLTLLALKSNADATLLNVKCQLYPELSESCALAALNEQQKNARAIVQKAKDDQMAKKVGQKIDKLFK